MEFLLPFRDNSMLQNTMYKQPINYKQQLVSSSVGAFFVLFFPNCF